MQIKRFVAEDNHTALRLVKEAMGPEAVIIASRELEEGVEGLVRTPAFHSGPATQPGLGLSTGDCVYTRQKRHRNP